MTGGKERKLIRAIFQYDDGQASYVSGEDASKWAAVVNNALMLRSTHGHGEQFKGIRFRKITIDELAELLKLR